MPQRMAALDGAAIRQARAELIGRRELRGRELGAQLAAQADEWFRRLAARLPPGWTLIATGGYAKGSLCPGSDLDVTLLHPPKTPDERVRDVAEGIWYPFWDGGLKLSPAAHSVRSLLALASNDLVTATAILDVRSLSGDETLAADVRRRAVDQWRKHPLPWLRRLHEATVERWAQFGEVSSLLEPNLKDGRGGLRDHDVMRWAVATGHDDVLGSLEASFDELDGPADELFNARCELHRSTGRAADTLLLEEQDAVAAALDIDDADVLMRRLSAAARTIEWASSRFWHRVDRIVDPPRWPGHRSRALVEPAPGVSVEGDELHLTLADLDDASLTFEVAAIAARNDIPLSREALLTLVEEGAGEPTCPWSERTRRAFVSLLGTGDALVATVEALEHYGLFSRFLPEWEHVRSLPQRNAFHIYNVDRHLLKTVANAAELVRTVTRPDLLLVAALLHDIGKGDPRDHTEVGIEMVGAMLPRMGFTAEDTATVTALVEHHLLLAETATRRDLADPRTAANVATALGDVDRLQLLRALTEADSLATGPAAWSTWKKSLIDRLVWSVSELLRGRTPPSTFDVAERFGPLLDRVRETGDVVTDFDDTDELVLLRVAARDRAGLFAKVAGTLVLHRVDVTAAEAWTSTDGIAVEQFQILPSPDGPMPFGRFHRDLDDVLAGRLDIGARLESRIKSVHRGYRRAVAAAPPRTEVVVSNEASDSTTMIDVRVPDGPALLYQLSSALATLGVDIRSARVATLGHEAVDVFYVQRPGPQPAQLPEAEHAAVRAALAASVSTD